MAALPWAWLAHVLFALVIGSAIAYEECNVTRSMILANVLGTTMPMLPTVTFAYPWYVKRSSKMSFCYPLHEAVAVGLCDQTLCKMMANKGYISDDGFFSTELAIVGLLDSNSTVLDVGSHMGEYMGLTLLAGAQYITMEAAPHLMDYQRELISLHNPQYANRVTFLQGYFGNLDVHTCVVSSSSDLQNRRNFFFMGSACTSRTDVRKVQVKRFDLRIIREIKQRNPSRKLVVKYDAMINLCAFNQSVGFASEPYAPYLGDMIEYEYVNQQNKYSEFVFGFPECLHGILEKFYDVYTIGKGKRDRHEIFHRSKRDPTTLRWQPAEAGPFYIERVKSGGAIPEAGRTGYKHLLLNNYRGPLP
jgi:hypothetical protein